MATRKRKSPSVYSTTANSLNPSNTPLTKPLPGRDVDMKQNNDGAYVFKLDDMDVLDRFLILGTSSNTYRVKAETLTEQHAQNIMSLVKTRGTDVVARIVEISVSRRAPKNDPALFALALVMTYGDDTAKTAAYAAIPQVARIGTHLLHLASYVNSLRGWGRGLRTAFSNWYTKQPTKGLAMNLVKYANRDGWTHADVLRLAHPKATGTTQQLLAYTAGKPHDFTNTEVFDFMAAVDAIKKAKDAKTAVALIESQKLPREVIPTELLNEVAVWESLLPHMGIDALLRNLATMTRIGVLTPLGKNTALVISKMADKDMIEKSRPHPLAILVALNTYKMGRGIRGTNSWTPIAQISDALEDLFYASFGYIEPTGKNFYLGIDVSGSMTGGEVGGMIGITPNIAAAVMAMVTARTEKNYIMKGFCHQLVDLGITAKDTLQSAIRKTQNNSFGSTNTSLAIEDALATKTHIDAFVIYTDNDVNTGDRHTAMVLEEYRKKVNPKAKLIVVGMTAYDFSIGDPRDGNTLNVVGFDTATPSVIANFVRG